MVVYTVYSRDFFFLKNHGYTIHSLQKQKQPKFLYWMARELILRTEQYPSLLWICFCLPARYT